VFVERLKAVSQVKEGGRGKRRCGVVGKAVGFNC